jgi:hypothetical protein
MGNIPGTWRVPSRSARPMARSCAGSARTRPSTQLDERRRIQASLDVVAEQAQEQATVLTALRREKAEANARIIELEAQLGKQ